MKQQTFSTQDNLEQAISIDLSSWQVGRDNPPKICTRNEPANEILWFFANQ